MRQLRLHCGILQLALALLIAVGVAVPDLRERLVVAPIPFAPATELLRPVDVPDQTGDADQLGPIWRWIEEAEGEFDEDAPPLPTSIGCWRRGCEGVVRAVASPRVLPSRPSSHHWAIGPPRA